MGVKGVTCKRVTTTLTIIQTASQYRRLKQQQENESNEALALNIWKCERPVGKCETKSEAK